MPGCVVVPGSACKLLPINHVSTIVTVLLKHYRFASAYHVDMHPIAALPYSNYNYHSTMSTSIAH